MKPEPDYKTVLAPMFDLAGKNALVVGGYGGLGGAIAWGLGSRGAHVAVGGRDGTKARAFADSMALADFSCRGYELDATNVESIGRAVDSIADDLDGIDIFVNCIGRNIEEHILDVTESAFDAVYAANLKSSMFLAQAVARHQVTAGRGGKHLHMLSVSAHRGYKGRGYSAYCSTKAALVMLVRQHALELAPDGIQVNGIAPTYVMTEMIRHKMEDPTLREELVSQIPAGRIADPADIAGPAVFLVSPAAEFVTGQVIYVDGGASASR